MSGKWFSCLIRVLNRIGATHLRHAYATSSSGTRAMVSDSICWPIKSARYIITPVFALHHFIVWINLVEKTSAISVCVCLTAWGFVCRANLSVKLTLDRQLKLLDWNWATGSWKWTDTTWWRRPTSKWFNVSKPLQTKRNCWSSIHRGSCITPSAT